MSKRPNTSFGYVGAALTDGSILATEASKTAFDSLRIEAERVQNTPYSFSRGNIFEFLSGAKLKILSAERGHFFRYEPVNAGRGLYTTPDDMVIYHNNGYLCFQAKVSTDPQWIIDQFSADKYMGMERITTSDMYGPVRAILERKAASGTITEGELDTLNHLRPGLHDPSTGAVSTVTNEELNLFEGKDGRVDLARLDSYIREQQNKAFLKECVNNTSGVTIASAISGCVFSSVRNLYSFFRDEQDGETTAKNIAADTAKAAGHGLLSSTIANGIKFVAFKSGNAFLRENVNALVIGNGAIDLGRAFYYFKKGTISFDDFLSNVIGTSAITLANIGVNYVLAGHPLIKLVSTIVMNQLIHGLIKEGFEECDSRLSHELALSLMDEIEKKVETLNKELAVYLRASEELMRVVRNIFDRALPLEQKDTFIRLYAAIFRIDLTSYDSFLDDLDQGKTIQISFGKKPS